MSTKKGLPKGVYSSKLTSAEHEVYQLILLENYTPQQLTIRRGCTRQAIHKILKSLRLKGYITNNNITVDKSRPTTQKKIRLHGQEWNIKILWKDHRYQNKLKTCNKLDISGSTIMLYSNSIEVHAVGAMFYANSPEKSFYESLKYWDRFFHKLENQLHIVILKDRYENIRLVNQHYADMENDLAWDCNKKKEKIKIYANDDGKLWGHIDHSFNVNEFETLHPQTAKHDMNRVLKQFNDMRDNNPPTISEVMIILKILLDQNVETATGLNAIVKLMQPKQEDTDLNKKIPDYLG